MAINVVKKIDGEVKVRNALISVSDKTGLNTFVPGLIDIVPDIQIFSTGGTFSAIEEILGDKAKSYLTQVSDYTGQPETQGGLVKTLDFKIYLGLLTETYNQDHQTDLKRTGAVPIDMVVCNLYPFSETIAKPDVTPELARGNIDIGGPCMLRAAAKNFIRVASIVNPLNYPLILDELAGNDGKISLAMRFQLAKETFKHTAVYDQAIADYLEERTLSEINQCYPEIL